MQEMVREERLFDLLFLGGADDVVENAGIIVDIAVVDVVGQLRLIFERLALIAHPLGDDEAAERDRRAQGRKRRLHILVFDAGAKAQIKAEHQKQYGDGGVEIDQDRNAAGERWHAACRHCSSPRGHSETAL